LQPLVSLVTLFFRLAALHDSRTKPFFFPEVRRAVKATIKGSQCLDTGKGGFAARLLLSAYPIVRASIDSVLGKNFILP